MGYLFREGVRNMYTHGFMSFAAVCVTVACLVIIGSFSLLIYNLSIFVSDMEQQNRVLAYVEETYDTAEAKSVGSRINLLENVREAVFISREEAGERFIRQEGGGEAYEGIDASTFRDRFEITLEDNSKMDETVKALEQIQGVVKVRARSELAKGFLKKRPLRAELRDRLKAAYPDGEAFASRLQGGLPAVSLHSQSALLTAFANDCDPSMAYAQVLLALSKPGDALLALSTSGNSASAVNAAKLAKAIGVTVIALTGERESALSALADCAVRVGESETYRVQELHLPVYHWLCAKTEEAFFET